MIPKTFQMLMKYYSFEYPFYSGRSVSCKICKESQWFTGMELKCDADNGWLKIFNHKAQCQAVEAIKKDLDSTNIRSGLVISPWPAHTNFSCHWFISSDKNK
jgi:hypothetical protein